MWNHTQLQVAHIFSFLSFFRFCTKNAIWLPKVAWNFLVPKLLRRSCFIASRVVRVWRTVPVHKQPRVNNNQSQLQSMAILLYPLHDPPNVPNLYTFKTNWISWGQNPKSTKWVTVPVAHTLCGTVFDSTHSILVCKQTIKVILANLPFSPPLLIIDILLRWTGA